MISNRLNVLIIVLLASAVNMSAYVFLEKQFIQQHDIDNETKALKSDNPSDFWESMVDNNLSFQKFQAKCHKNKKTEKFIQEWKSRWPKFDVSDSAMVLRDKQALCSRIFSKVGLNDSIACCIVNDTSFNSFSVFAPRGYVVALSAGVIDSPDITEEMIVGMIAHEYAHVYLSHILQNSILGGKIEGNNGIGLGLIGACFGGAIGGLIGGAIEGAAVGSAIKSWEPKGVDARGYNVNYYREMVLEADLIAYRFMEWSGIGGEHYIKLLRLIGAKHPESYLGDENSFYTNHQERIRFINYVKDHPEIGNTINKKLRKKKK